MNKLILCLAVPVLGASAALANHAGSLALQMQIEQTAYLCDTGHEVSCHKLSLWTGGQCASPRQIGGCNADSYVRVDRDQSLDRRAVHDQKSLDKMSAEMPVIQIDWDSRERKKGTPTRFLEVNSQAIPPQNF